MVSFSSHTLFGMGKEQRNVTIIIRLCDICTTYFSTVLDM